MKKTLFLSALVALAMTFVSCIDGTVDPNRTISVELKKDSKIEIAENHPWVDGAQDLTVISNYQATFDITKLFEDGLPEKGQKIRISGKAKSDVPVKKICARLVDTSATAGYWMELNATDGGYTEAAFILAKDVKKDTAFDINIPFVFSATPKEKVSLIVWYDVGDATPDGPAVLTVQ